MGIDIRELRKDQGGDPDKVKESEKKRFRDPALVDEIIALDEQWRQTEFNMNRANQDKNNVVKDIGKRKKENKEDQCNDLLEKKNDLEYQCEQLKKQVQELTQIRDKKLVTIGNLVHESCIINNNEDFNDVVTKWGEPNKLQITQKPGACYHHQVLYMIDGYDPKAGSKIAGTRGYFLKNYGFLLCQALQTYSMKFLMDRGYSPVQPPFFMKQEVMGETCQLSDFDDQLYAVLAKSGNIGGPQDGQQLKEKQDEKKEDKEYYLIATSEQPISALHRKERLEFKEGEMIKYAGFSTCFRKEAGKYGKETWGTFRVHQFEKVEQFVICRPEDSWQQHEEMAKISREFLESLELPYRQVNIVSGALNDAAAKKYDIEAWFPGYNEYKELMSISNCTDFQSRALDIKLGFQQKNQKEKEIANKTQYVHMLNGTLCAVQRTLCCILENYQTEEGVKVPKVLQPYLGGVELIKYIKSIPKQQDME